MLVQKLNCTDLNNEKMSKFDGTMVYAQNKRQQVVMTDFYAKQFPNIYFATMHPGWADTPAVQTSMPSFREKMINKLRTSEQGADTLVWMCAYEGLEKIRERCVLSRQNPSTQTSTSSLDKEHSS